MKLILFSFLLATAACEKVDIPPSPSLVYRACSGREVASNDDGITPRYNESRSCYQGSKNSCLLNFSYDKTTAGILEIPVGKDNRMVYPNGGAPACDGANCKQPTLFTKGSDQGSFMVETSKNGEFGWQVNQEYAKGKCSSDLRGCSPLPVTLTSFTGAWDKRQQVNIKWTTASEKSNKGFTIEFVNPCQPATSFSRGDFVPSQSSNSVSQLNYSYGFPVTEGGTYYFRLYQEDFDGTKEYSPVIAVRVGN